MSASDCLFCKINDGKIPSKKLGENAKAFAIADITPQAPFHALVMPKRHVASLNDMSAADRAELLPALYELKDGQPALVNFQVQSGTYVVPKVVDRGYLALGKDRFSFEQGR